ncbi:MAG: Si-specific NAD(P)(+) transhydrogenase [Proteobacteria bacterium]|nr:Si-specific NAD(P)(+) transhydrogenase [Pseudomonadota bacterium]
MAHCDLVVLGSGPAGRRAAVQAAKLGHSVLVIDDRSRVGGVSVHTGTIPSKTLRETALNLSGWRERGFYGRSHRLKHEIGASDLAHRMAKTLEHEIAVLEHQFARNGVKVVFGHGAFVDPHTIAITQAGADTQARQLVTADKVLIAVGTRPHRPAGIPFNGTSVLDSDDFALAPRLPRSLTVVGGGVIGLEYATIFSALDVPVTLIEPRARLLEFMDEEVIEHLSFLMRDRGMVLRLGSEVERIRFAANGWPVTMLADGRQACSEVVLYAAGRVGATAELNLAACGLEADSRGRLAVNPESFQTMVPHIYAAGDVIGFPSLASTSMEQGRAAACHAFGEPVPGLDQAYPLGIYTVPEMSAVGLTEAEAKARGLAFECGIARFRETSRGHIMGVESGILKLVCCRESRRLLGVHIIGEGATELVHIGQAVINLGGTIDYFVENSFNYPTLAEAYKVAGLDAWNRLRNASGEVVPLAPVKRKRKAG